jgi:hypothetical protein
MPTIYTEEGPLLDPDGDLVLVIHAHGHPDLPAQPRAAVLPADTSEAVVEATLDALCDQGFRSFGMHRERPDAPKMTVQDFGRTIPGPIPV